MSHHESTARGADGRMVDRMLFFSDAVFAIVLTIMVLELHPPVMEGAHSVTWTSEAIWQFVAEKFRIFFAYLVSFALVGLWWSVHMRVTRQLHNFDWPTAILNFVFLLTVTMIPFAASILGQSITAAASWEIYWGVNGAASLALTLMLLAVSRDGGRLIGGMSTRERVARLLQSIGPGVGFCAGVWLAAVGEVFLSRFCWIAILPCMLLARLIYKAPKTAKAATAPADA